MSQNLDKKNLDKNVKLMAISAIVLLVLFLYTLFKSKNFIQSPSYNFGIGFLLILFIIAIIIKIKERKLKTFFKKNNESSFEKELNTQNNINEQNFESNIKAAHSNIKFKDVAGISGVKRELEEIVNFLNEPNKFLKYGVKLPKGVLLVGPPGVGKTLIARAVAGEANVPFYYQSGASFVQIYVGMGAKRVRELFLKAKANSPSIIFIDEIDAVGKERSRRSNDEREATLNELLTQMDGFDGNSTVIVIAATNKIEVLDEALLRAGRFDRRVFINLPNLEDRKKILSLYLKNKKHNFDIEKLSFDTSGFNSATLATLINEALLNMIKRKASFLETEDIELAKNKLEFGKKEKILLTSDEKEILAIYQASKAYISKEKISLFDEGINKIHSIYPSYKDLLEQLRRYLSGSIGVEIMKKEKYAINCDDLKKADILAIKIVEDYKMSNNAQVLVNNIANELRSELSHNANEIERLKLIMLEKEVILKNEI